MITIETIINAPKDIVWKMWVEPEHIEQWNFAGDDWYCPKAEVDLRIGGRLQSTMAARDGSFQFDFGGSIVKLADSSELHVLLDDNRKWNTQLIELESGTRVIESFDAETENPEEMQRMGWQMILDRFKNYVESQL